MKAKSKISGMLHSSFKPDKCKTSLKMAIARIKLLKNKREVLVRQMRRDLAQLLESGQDQTARIRVEHVIREEKTMTAYDLIDVYCELIVARMAIIDSQKNCPIDLKESISSVVFASPRCADIPELMDIRKHFVAKYGKEFITAAVEVRPDSGVSRLIVEKLSAKAPDIDTKVKVLTEIATEHNINWDPKAFEEKIQKPKDDLLDGPSTFASASKMAMDSSIPKPSAENWNNQPPTSASEISNRQSQPNFSVQTPTDTLHSKASDWNIEFKDAASAAKAAAESAEMASMAARAAAELASQSNFTVNSSLGRYQSSTYLTKGEQSESFKSSTLESTQVVKEAKYAEDYSRKGHHTNLNRHNIQNDDAVQSNRRKDKSASEIHVTTGNLTPKGSWSGDVVTGYVEPVDFPRDENSKRLDKNPSEIRVRTGHLTPKRSFKEGGGSQDSLYVDDGEAYNSMHPSFSGTESMFKNFDYYGNQPTNTSNQKYEKSASSHQDATYDWDDHESVEKVEDSVDANFDHYESDTDDHTILENYGKDKLFNPTPNKQREEYMGFPFNRNTSDDEQHGSGAIFNQSRSGHFSAAETKHEDNAETIAEVNPKFDDNMHPSYDSDSLKSESDEEIDNFTNKEVTKASSFLPGNSKPKGSSPVRSGNEAEFINDKEEDSILNFPDIDDNFGEESSSTRTNWSKPGLSVGNQQKTPRAESPKGLYDSGEIPGEYESPYSIVSDESYTSGTLNFGGLKGGRRNRGYGSPKVESFIVGSSLGPKQGVDEASVLEKNPDIAESAIYEMPTVGMYDKDLGTTYTSSRSSSVSVYTSGDDTLRRKATDGKSAAVRKSVMQFDDDVLEDPVQESYNLPLRKEQRQSNIWSSLTNVGAKGLKEHSYASRTEDLEDNSPVKGREDQDVSPFSEKLKISRPNMTMLPSETKDEEFSDQKLYVGSRMQPRNSDSDYKAEETEIRSNKEFKLSRRTRGTPAGSKLDIRSGTADPSLRSSQSSSISESSAKTPRHPGHLDSKVIPKSRESLSYTRGPQTEQVDNLSSSVKGTKMSPKSEDVQASFPEDDGNEKTESPSAKQTSRENSLNKSSHVHPKLPDYETFAAHFHSLRSNVRPK